MCVCERESARQGGEGSVRERTREGEIGGVRVMNSIKKVTQQAKAIIDTQM